MSSGSSHWARKTFTLVLPGTKAKPAKLAQPSPRWQSQAIVGEEWCPAARVSTCWASLGKCGQDSSCPLLSFQVTAASLEASTTVHPPSREPEPRPGAPAESTPRGPRPAQEPGPTRCQQSSVAGAAADLAGTGRHQCSPVSGCWRGSCHRSREGGSQHCVWAQTSTPWSPCSRGEPGGCVSLPGVWIFFSHSSEIKSTCGCIRICAS